MIIDGITAGGKHSFVDFGLCIKEKKIGLPQKKRITAEVPHMNGSYDFTTMSGDATWSDREISYTFDILGETERDMNTQRDAILNWLMTLDDVDIYDDVMPGYHFHGSYSDGDISDEIELSTFTAKFACYPFRIADSETSIALDVGESSVSHYGQAVKCYITCTAAGSITLNGSAQSFLANTRTELSSLLIHGDNSISLTTSGSAILSFTEEII